MRRSGTQWRTPRVPGPRASRPITSQGFLATASPKQILAIEGSVNRPTLLRQSTLRRVDATQAIELNAESLYWGARELVRRLTADAARMAAADAYLRPMLRG